MWPLYSTYCISKCLKIRCCNIWLHDWHSTSDCEIQQWTLLLLYWVLYCVCATCRNCSKVKHRDTIPNVIQTPKYLRLHIVLPYWYIETTDFLKFLYEITPVRLCSDVSEYSHFALRMFCVYLTLSHRSSYNKVCNVAVVSLVCVRVFQSILVRELLL